MKKVALLLLLCVVSFSCSETAIDPGVYSKSITGRWKTLFSSRAGAQLINTQDCVNMKPTGLYWSFIFGADGSFTMYNTCSGEILETGLYTYVNGELLLELNGTTTYLITNIKEAGADRISMDSERSSSGGIESYHLIMKRF
ncbi:hypothetical protein GR160_13585 [Flavobacterium sp. Sd200]|uniref:hypothetical protein n=1 Tax=Flavobacterium sp. Sd200 TaxID=2692211 RepID=UPI001370927E|nr:hypothetical protein [Flavobacterium sp. Sd200]MXN92256.1 hypothetical protein [Flavobacterium sp. Sd200]